MTSNININLIHQAISNEIDNKVAALSLKISENKDQSISIKAKNILIAKVKFPKKVAPYIDIRSENKDMFPAEVISEFNEEWCRISITRQEDVLEYSKQFSRIFTDIMESSGGDPFGCCSRYIQCSDAKKCIHPDPVFASACMYRKNLESGKIFYGKNRNI